MLTPLRCHWKEWLLPVAVTVKLAGSPAHTVWFAGSTVIVGATPASWENSDVLPLLSVAVSTSLSPAFSETVGVKVIVRVELGIV